MKRNILTFTAAVALFTSCATNYVVTDSVGRHLDGTRTVLSADTTSLDDTPYGLWQRTVLDREQVFDFRNERDTMRYAYIQVMPRDGWTVTGDSLPRMLRPEVTVTKQFHWFTTRYRYMAVFPALDSLPVPISQYLTDDEQQLLFQPLDLPADWNGADMYALLDKLNTKYIKWWRHCFFEKEYEIWYNNLDSTRRALLAQYHDTLLVLVREDLPDDKFSSLRSMANLFPELASVTEYLANQDIQTDEMVMDWYKNCLDLENRVLWRIELPGGRTAEHMISSERLITGDYTISLYSYIFNWWAISITVIFLLSLIFLLPRRRS